MKLPNIIYKQNFKNAQFKYWILCLISSGALEITFFTLISKYFVDTFIDLLVFLLVMSIVVLILNGQILPRVIEKYIKEKSV